MYYFLTLVLSHKHILCLLTDHIESRVHAIIHALHCTAQCIQYTLARQSVLGSVSRDLFFHSVHVFTYILMYLWNGKKDVDLSRPIYIIPSRVCNTDYYFLSHLISSRFVFVWPFFTLFVLVFWFVILLHFFLRYSQFASKEVQVR